MNLFSKLFGDKDYTNTIGKVEDLISTLPKIHQPIESEDISGKTLKTLLDETSENEVEKLFEKVSVPHERIARYNLYEEINKSVPIIKRIIKVYIANIIPKNPVTGKCFIYKESDDSDLKNDKESQDKIDFFKRFVEECVENYDLTNKYKQITLPDKLVYGDAFIEVVDVVKESENVDLTSPQSTSLGVLSESKLNTFKERVDRESNGNISDSKLNLLLSELVDMLIEVDDKSQPIMGDTDSHTPKNLKNSNDSGTKEKDKSKRSFADILLKVHKPKNIIILETNYGSRLGYLEILKQNDSSASFSMGDSISAVVGKITALAKKDDNKQEKLINMMITHVLKKVLSKSEKAKKELNNQSPEEAIKNLDPAVYGFLKRLFIEQGLYKKKFNYHSTKVRFIPPDRMVQFTSPSTEYDPYGESVVEPLILPCKLYMLAQLSNAVSKLSRASLIRTWTVDVGSSQMHGQLLQSLKRQLYNSRLSLNDMASFKSMPKILSDYKDLFILSRQGMKPVDVNVQSFGDVSIKTQDLEDSRREIIALSGIPAPYLGYMDVVELREQLVHTNVSFATEVIDMQESDMKALNDLIDIIAEIKGINEKPSEYVQIKLVPPVVLILQLIEMTLSSVGNIAGVFQNMQIPVDPYYFLEQYVPHIDWEKFKQQSTNYKLEQKTTQEMGGQEQMGGPMGGGF